MRVTHLLIVIHSFKQVSVDSTVLMPSGDHSVILVLKEQEEALGFGDGQIWI